MDTTRAPSEDPYRIDPCPECGAEDAEFGQHEPGCPSGYPVRDDPELVALGEATREYEDQAYDTNWDYEGPSR